MFKSKLENLIVVTKNQDQHQTMKKLQTFYNKEEYNWNSLVH